MRGGWIKPLNQTLAAEEWWGFQTGFNGRHSPWFPFLIHPWFKACESNLGSGRMMRVLKQVLNDDIRPAFHLLIPPWYVVNESNLGSWGMVRVLKQVLNDYFRLGYLLLIPPCYVWGGWIKPLQLRSDEGSQAGFKWRHSPWFPSLNSSMVWEVGESNLGSWGMVRVLKQVPQSSLCVGPKASPEVLFNSRPLKQCMTYLMYKKYALTIIWNFYP
jgi:hypothetical protein